MLDALHLRINRVHIAVNLNVNSETSLVNISRLTLSLSDTFGVSSILDRQLSPVDILMMSSSNKDFKPNNQSPTSELYCISNSNRDDSIGTKQLLCGLPVCNMKSKYNSTNVAKLLSYQSTPLSLYPSGQILL